MSKKQQRIEIQRWEKQSKIRDKLREHRKINENPNEEEDEYTRIMSKARKEHSIPDAPSMPLVRIFSQASVTGGGTTSQTKRHSAESEWKHFVDTREHQDHVAEAGLVSCEWMAMVHTPVKMSDAMKIPKAKEALDKEWDKLGIKNAWDLKTVRPRQQVIKDAKKNNATVHFGNLMELCHKKHSEQSEEMHRYNGRVVFRGDNVKDESGFYAVFSEQGTSASHLAAAKFLDAISRLPGNAGEDSDATGAYTQVTLSDMTKNGVVSYGKEHVETWTSLPRHRRPK